MPTLLPDRTVMRSPSGPPASRECVEIHFRPTMSFSRTGSLWKSGNRVPLHFAWFVMLPLAGSMRILAHEDFSATLLEAGRASVKKNGIAKLAAEDARADERVV